MKKLIFTLLAYLFICPIAFSQAFSENFFENERDILNLLHSIDGWSELYLVLAEQKENEGFVEPCEGDVVLRFLYGHAALAIGNANDAAMNQFYCEKDSINSESLNAWESWAQKLLQTYPESANANYLYADALARNGNLEEALPYFNKAIELQPKHYLAYNSRGTVSWILEFRKGSNYCMECYYDWMEATHVNSSFADGYANMGVGGILSPGAPVEALKDFDKAIELDPAFGLAYNGKKVVYHTQGDGRRYYDMIPFAKHTPFAILDRLVEIDSVKEARGVLNSMLPGSGDAIWNSMAPGESAMKLLGTGAINNGMGNGQAPDLSGSSQQSGHASRGGVYSIQRDGENKHVNLSISGTWFLINYPYVLLKSFKE